MEIYIFVDNNYLSADCATPYVGFRIRKTEYRLIPDLKIIQRPASMEKLNNLWTTGNKDTGKPIQQGVQVRFAGNTPTSYLNPIVKTITF